MKKINLVLLVSIMCLCNLTIKEVYAEETNSFTQEELTYFENSYNFDFTKEFYLKQDTNHLNDPLYPANSNRGSIFMAVSIIFWTIQGMIWLGEFVVYIGYQEPDWNAVVKWADENGYNPYSLQYEVVNRVVDNGCYSQYFPANPFCRSIIEGV